MIKIIMDYLNVVILFSLGVILQAIILTIGKIDIDNLIKICLILVGSFVLSFLITIEYENSFNNVTLYAFFIFIFSFLFAIYLKEAILPEINELTILSYSLIFWYIFLTHFDFKPTIGVVLALMATVGTFIIAFINFKLHLFWKLFFYIWFLIIDVFLIFSQFSFGNLALLLYQNNSVTELGGLDSLLMGMSFQLLVAFSVYIFELIPVPRRGQLLENRIKEVEQHITLLTSKYSDVQLNPIIALLIIAFQISVFVLNYYFKLLPDYILINFSIISTPQVSSFFLNRSNSHG